eukprot:scaffold81336_cov29-Tisochrysis_lutea.AAC.2
MAETSTSPHAQATYINEGRSFDPIPRTPLPPCPRGWTAVSSSAVRMLACHVHLEGRIVDALLLCLCMFRLVNYNLLRSVVLLALVTAFDVLEVAHAISREHWMKKLHGAVSPRGILTSLEAVNVELPDERTQVIVLEVERKYILPHGKGWVGEPSRPVSDPAAVLAGRRGRTWANLVRSTILNDSPCSLQHTRSSDAGDDTISNNLMRKGATCERVGHTFAGRLSRASARIVLPGCAASKAPYFGPLTLSRSKWSTIGAKGVSPRTVCFACEAASSLFGSGRGKKNGVGGVGRRGLCWPRVRGPRRSVCAPCLAHACRALGEGGGRWRAPPQDWREERAAHAQVAARRDGGGVQTEERNNDE